MNTPIHRRTLLGFGSLAVLAGSTAALPIQSTTPAASPSESPGLGPGSPRPSGTVPASPAPRPPTASAPPAGPRPVPQPRFALAKAPGGGIDGDRLDRALAALPPFRGGALRRVVVRPGTYRRRTVLRVPSGVHLVAAGARFVSDVPGAQEPLVAISGARDVRIEGGIWDGNAKQVRVATEWKHVIRVHNSRRITLTGLITQNARGDGIYLGTHTTACQDITIHSVKSQHNYRNGMSITACTGLTCTDSIFSANGRTAPMAGVDIEPNDPRAPIRALEFTRCAFTGNAARGFLLVMQRSSPDLPGSVRLDQCTVEKNAMPSGNTSLWAGITLIRPRGVLITNSLVTSNHVGVAVQSRRGTDPASQLNRGTVELDRVDVVDSNREGLRLLSGVRRLRVSRTQFLSNSREPDGFFSGILLGGGSDMTFTECSSRGARRFGLQAASTVRKVRLTRCDLSGNEEGELDAPRTGVTVVQ